MIFWLVNYTPYIYLFAYIYLPFKLLKLLRKEQAKIFESFFRILFNSRGIKKEYFEFLA